MGLCGGLLKGSTEFTINVYGWGFHFGGLRIRVVWVQHSAGTGSFLTAVSSCCYLYFQESAEMMISTRIPGT